MIAQSIGNKPNPQLAVKEITNLYLRGNFQALSDYFDKQNQLLNFKFIEFQTTGAVTNLTVPHGLGFIPKDIIRSKVVGSGTCTFNHSLFDKQSLNITTTGAVRVRCFVGTYFRDGSPIDPTATDTEDFFAKLPSIPGKNGNVVSALRSYTVSDTDDLVLVNTPDNSTGTSVILPSATEFEGRKITIRKIDDTFIQHTISTVNSQIINGVSGKTTFILSTFQERVTFISDGSGWLVDVHDYAREWRSTSYANIVPTSAAFGTVTGATYRWRRDGDSIIYSLDFISGTPAASNIAFALPTNIRCNSSKLTTTAARTYLGHAARLDSGAGPTGLWSAGNVRYVFYDGSDNANLYLALTTGSQRFNKDTGSGFVAASNVVTSEFRVPVTGWEG